MADVSVIIPTYNRLWCLPRAVESCRNTRCVTQIIVVDDGSTDGTAEWLKKQTDLTVLSQHNQGQTWAVNRGFAEATGTYIRFLDSDDFLAPGAIDLQWETAEREKADLVYGRVDSFFERDNRTVMNAELLFWDDFLAVQLGEGDGSHFSGMLFHRNLVEQVPRRPEFSFREDRMFLLEIGLLKPKLALTPGGTSTWTKHDSQMHDTYQGLKLTVAHWHMLEIYRHILQQLEGRGELTERRKKASTRVLWPLAHEIAKIHHEEAKRVVDWIYQLEPAFVPPEKGLLGRSYRSLGFARTERWLSWRRAFLAGAGYYRD